MTAKFKLGAAGMLLVGSLFASSAQGATSPFSTMAGSWVGEGTMTTSDGGNERLRCRASYQVGGAGDNLHLSLRCASESYNFNLAGDVTHRNGMISGSWTEASRNAAGTIYGRATGEHIQASARGDNFSASLSMTTRGNRQSVSIRSQSAEVSGVSITLSRR